jgi:capsule polysaccharide export protein KpsE/RkpR
VSLDRYLHALARYWYVIAILVLAGGLGMYAYLNTSGTVSASATVAVFEPAVLRVAADNQAEVTFDTVLQSRAVAERVIQQQGLNTTAKAFQSKVTVSLSKQLVANVASPLYVVTVKDADPKRAVILTNAVIDQAKAVFLQVNAVSIAQLDAAYAPEEQRLNSQLDGAQAALTDFETKNDAWQLPSQIDTQRTLVGGLLQASLVNPAHSADTASPAALTTAMTQAQSELDRLRGLENQYSRLSFNVAVATAAVNQFVTHVNDNILTGSSAAGTTAEAAATAANKQLDTARTALTDFQAANGVDNLQTDMDHQLQIVTALRQQSLTANATDATLIAARTTENQTLQRLLTLLPTYDRLSTQVALAQAGITQLQARKIDSIVGTNGAPSVQVKMLDTPLAQTGTFRAIMFDTLGVLLGLFLSCLIIYLFAYFDRLPRTVADAREIVGIPVLVRVPHAF